jgi:hypothetical protein
VVIVRDSSLSDNLGTGITVFEDLSNGGTARLDGSTD